MIFLIENNKLTWIDDIYYYDDEIIMKFSGESSGRKVVKDSLVSDSDGNITEIIIPEGIEIIGEQAFRFAFSHLKKVTLPDSVKSVEKWAFCNSPKCCDKTVISSMTFRGVTFNPTLEKTPHIGETVEMIAKKDYSVKLGHALKYPIILQIYFNDGDEVTEEYIRKNFHKFFDFLCKKRDFETFEKLIKTNKFITKRNINTYIKIADEKENHEFFDILTEYEENL